MKYTSNTRAMRKRLFLSLAVSVACIGISIQATLLELF